MQDEPEVNISDEIEESLPLTAEGEELPEKRRASIANKRKELTAKGFILSDNWKPVQELLVLDDTVTIDNIQDIITSKWLMTQILRLFCRTRSVHEQTQHIRILAELQIAMMTNPETDKADASMINALQAITKQTIKQKDKQDKTDKQEKEPDIKL